MKYTTFVEIIIQRIGQYVNDDTYQVPCHHYERPWNRDCCFIMIFQNKLGRCHRCQRHRCYRVCRT